MGAGGLNGAISTRHRHVLMPSVTNTYHTTSATTAAVLIPSDNCITNAADNNRLRLATIMLIMAATALANMAPR